MSSRASSVRRGSQLETDPVSERQRQEPVHGQLNRMMRQTTRAIHCGRIGLARQIASRTVDSARRVRVGFPIELGGRSLDLVQRPSSKSASMRGDRVASARDCIRLCACQRWDGVTRKIWGDGAGHGPEVVFELMLVLVGACTWPDESDVLWATQESSRVGQTPLTDVEGRLRPACKQR